MSDTMNNVDRRKTLKEVTDGSLAFFREARNGSAVVEQANIGAKFAQRVISGIGMDLKCAIAAPKIEEIEKAASQAA